MKVIRLLGGLAGWHTCEVTVAEKNQGRRLVLTAVVDGRDGGHVHLLATQCGYVYLSNLYVEPRFRGRGVGRQLMTTAIGLCQGQRVELIVSASLAGLPEEHLVAWYGRLGFVFQRSAAARPPRDSDTRRMALEGRMP